MTACFTCRHEVNGSDVLFAKVFVRFISDLVAVLKFNLEVGRNAFVFDLVVAVRCFHSFNSFVDIFAHCLHAVHEGAMGCKSLPSFSGSCCGCCCGGSRSGSHSEWCSKGMIDKIEEIEVVEINAEFGCVKLDSEVRVIPHAGTS